MSPITTLSFIGVGLTVHRYVLSEQYHFIFVFGAAICQIAAEELNLRSVRIAFSIMYSYLDIIYRY